MTFSTRHRPQNHGPTIFTLFSFEKLLFYFRDLLEGEYSEMLVIKDVKLVDRADYKCIAENNFGFKEINYYITIYRKLDTFIYFNLLFTIFLPQNHQQ